MKQFITQEQVDALSEKQRKRYAEWILAHEWIPDIAHLIWFIDDLTKSYGGWWQIQRNGRRTAWRLESACAIQFDEEGSPELCDALWEAVKVLLEEDEEAV